MREKWLVRKRSKRKWGRGNVGGRERELMKPTKTYLIFEILKSLFQIPYYADTSFIYTGSKK